jgi:hypothetical protein
VKKEVKQTNEVLGFAASSSLTVILVTMKRSKRHKHFVKKRRHKHNRRSKKVNRLSNSPDCISDPTVDRISDLPDSILCHILSFLPTKQALTTTILSKRWKPVWLSVLALNFDDKTFKDFNTFREFVYSIMFILRDKKTSIHSFCLKLGNSSRFDQKHFNRIFKFVMERGGVDIDFNMDDKVPCIKLPLSILNFKKLQVLKLTHLEMRDLDLVDFPQLKTLHLDRLKFKSHQHYGKFLFGCPVLEDLHTKRIKFHELFVENSISLPNLVKVRFYDALTPMSLVCKAKILHIEKV